MLLDLTPDELLSTTRAVRKRLDLSRPVEQEVLEQCLRLAQQAPTGSYREDWHFVVVTDADKRAKLADLWRDGAAQYMNMRDSSGAGQRQISGSMRALSESVMHLIEHLHEVPVHVIPCIEGRTDGAPSIVQSGKWTSITQAAWSFMLAARSRGLGTVWTSFHLFHEREAAELLGIPHDEVMQVALIPTAYAIGTEFRPAKRKPLETMVHWDAW